MRTTDPRLIGFLVGFGGVLLLSLLVVSGWTLLKPSASPTVAPSAAPMSERVTIVPSAAEALPSPSGAAPSLAPTPGPTQGSPPPSRTESIEYTVRDGDTLFDIALAYGVSIETIQSANNLDADTIIPGQVLQIPPRPIPPPTPYTEDDLIVHTVASGETLIGIAEHYSVTVEMLQVANDLDTATLQPGWQLYIPAGGNALSSLISPTSAPDAAWKPSLLEGNLEEGYPLILEGARFAIHYQPDTPAARAPNQMAMLVESVLNHIEDKLKIKMESYFDVYFAGTLFAADDMALRGRSFSSQRRNFYLYDDTGTPNERRYLITHELTHLVAWHAIGQPSSVMLHEGLAIYTGIEAMEAAGFIPLSHFCAAYQQAGQLPPLTANRSYLGHIRDLDLYYSAGCFARYLIDEFGVDDFKRLFTSGDYPGIYGRTQAQLEAAWVESLESTSDELAFAPNDLVDAVAAVADAYALLFADFAGTPSQMAAYRKLDQARIAMLQGRFEDASVHLSDFAELLTER